MRILLLHTQLPFATVPARATVPMGMGGHLVRRAVCVLPSARRESPKGIRRRSATCRSPAARRGTARHPRPARASGPTMARAGVNASPLPPARTLRRPRTGGDTPHGDVPYRRHGTAAAQPGSSQRRPSGDAPHPSRTTSARPRPRPANPRRPSTAGQGRGRRTRGAADAHALSANAATQRPGCRPGPQSAPVSVSRLVQLQVAIPTLPVRKGGRRPLVDVPFPAYNQQRTRLNLIWLEPKKKCDPGEGVELCSCFCAHTSQARD